MSHDTIVIGAGTNGLAAAHLLARAGRRVVVLERQDAITAGPTVGWVPPGLIADLDLIGAGLRVTHPDPWVAVPLDGGGRLALSTDLAKSVEAIRRISPADAAKWPEFARRMRTLAGVLEALYAQPAPDVETHAPGELLRLARLGLKVRRHGRQAIIDLLRVLPMSVQELLDDWFESDALKAAIGAAGVMHLRQGPRSAGTAFNLLHHHTGSPAGVFRPPHSNLGEVLARLPGVEVRRGSRVRRITVKAGRATGVALDSGETIAAAQVVSSADPRATLLGLLEPGWLDPELGLAVRNIKCRGVAARVTLTLMPQLLDGELQPFDVGFSSLLLAPSLEYIERAYDAAKYGQVSEHPWIEARVERGRIVAHVQYVPYALAGADWDDARRAAIGETVIAALAEHVAGLREIVTATDVVTPKDLEDRTGLTEGHAYGGELTLDQVLFTRPVSGWSRHSTPVAGLFLCGAGTHPGGAIAGGAGRLAARAVLRSA